MKSRLEVSVVQVASLLVVTFFAATVVSNLWARDEFGQDKGSESRKDDRDEKRDHKSDEKSKGLSKEGQHESRDSGKHHAYGHDKNHKRADGSLVYDCGGTKEVAVKIGRRKATFSVPVKGSLSDSAVGFVARALKNEFVLEAESEYGIHVDEGLVEREANHRHDQMVQYVQSFGTGATLQPLSEIQDTIRNSLAQDALDTRIRTEISKEDPLYRRYLNGEAGHPLDWTRGQVIGEFEISSGLEGIHYEAYVLNRWWRKFYRSTEVELKDSRIEDVLKAMRKDGDYSPDYFQPHMRPRDPSAMQPPTAVDQ